LLDDNLAAWTERWRLIDEARESVDVDYFIFSQDVFGMAFLGHLLDKALHGVRVRMLLDAQGLTMSKQSLDTDCLGFAAAAENVSIRIHRSFGRRLLEALLRLDLVVAAASDHDKLIVVDRRAVVVGGRNIEAKYFAHPDDLPEAFHDLDAVLEGPAIAETVTSVFETTFESERASPMNGRATDANPCAAASRLAYEAMDAWLDGQPLDAATQREIEEHEMPWIAELNRFPLLKGAGLQGRQRKRISAEARILDSLPRAGSPRDAVTQSLARLFQAASDDIVMESPYLVLTRDAAAMLEATGKRGVEMTLVTNSPASTDNAVSQLYFREQWARLLAKVPQLRLFAAGTSHNVHSKVVVFDGQVVLLGSYNLDPFSMLISGEIMVAIWSRELAAQASGISRGMIARGAPGVYEYTIERDAEGNPVRTASGEPKIAFGPADHTDASKWPRTGFRWVPLRFVPWALGLPPFF
jgi:phosphatidylserine/phosphatidylglycerophosphate/cardiolipin synthase-like enzyme